MCEKKSKKHPYELTIKERYGAPKTFEYEMQMFCWSIQMFEYLKNPCSILLNDGIRNSILETSLLHVRNLLEFFTGDRPMKGNLDEDSIRAGYFVDEPHKKGGWWKSSNLSYTQSRKTNINKSLSHLTFKRIKENYKWDDLPKIKEEIEKAYTEFLKLLPQEDRAKWPSSENSGID